jgi:hypothetical protein
MFESGEAEATEVVRGGGEEGEVKEGAYPPPAPVSANRLAAERGRGELSLRWKERKVSDSKVRQHPTVLIQSASSSQDWARRRCWKSATHLQKWKERGVGGNFQTPTRLRLKPAVLAHRQQQGMDEEEALDDGLGAVDGEEGEWELLKYPVHYTATAARLRAKPTTWSGHGGGSGRQRNARSNGRRER